MTRRGLLIGGFGSLKWYYSPLRTILNRRNLSVDLLNPGPLGMNIWPLRYFEANATAALANEEEVFLIGHSLGGIQAMWAAYHHPDKVKKVFAIGSPVHGSPHEVYEEGIRTLLDVPKEEWDRFQNKMLPAVAPKVVTISCPYDIMAPVDRCFVEGAKNYIVTPTDSFATTSHIIIPYLAESLTIVETELSDEK